MANFTIGISEMQVIKGDQSVITYALGSCVGVALYDATHKIAGLAHVLMPSSAEIRDTIINPAKYMDTAIPALIQRMEQSGAIRGFFTAKLAGGAQMFGISGGASSKLNIGDRNVAAARQLLSKLGIRIVAEDTGANYGRTVELFAANGIYRIKALTKGYTEI